MPNLYDVVILPLAESDIVDNTDYIFFDKQSPETARKLLQGFYEMISGLEFMPQQHELDEDEELSSRAIRKCYYKNYKIYFYIDESKKTVYILRVLHMLVNAKPLLLKLDY